MGLKELLNNYEIVAKYFFAILIFSTTTGPSWCVSGMDVFGILNPGQADSRNVSVWIPPTETDDHRAEVGREENGETMKPHDFPPQVTISGNHGWDNFLQCNYAHPDSNSLWLSYIECHSPKKCQQKLPCLLHNKNCATHAKVISNGQLYRRGESGSIKMRLSVESGMVACTSDPDGDPRLVRRTMDYFYMSLDLKRHLASTPMSLPNLSLIEIEVYRFAKKSSLRWAWNGAAYVNEEILISCHIAPFLYTGPKSLSLMVSRIGGPILKLDLTMDPSIGYSNRKSGSVRFRIPKDAVALSCSATESLSRSTIEEVISLKTQDLPLNFTSKTDTETELPFHAHGNETFGCDFLGSSSQKKSLDLKIFDADVIAMDDVTRSIRSLIDLLRLKEMAATNFSCINLTDGQPDIVRHFDYYASVQRLWPVKPQIEKPEGQQVVTLSGFGHRKLSCKYGGQPMPYIMWLRDGKEFWYDIGKRDEDDDQMEISLLNLEAHNSNFTKSTSMGPTNYTCMAVNGLGYDTLEFLIKEAEETMSSQLSESNDVAHGTNYTWFILWSVTLIGFILAVLGVAYYRRKYLSTQKFLFKMTTQTKPKDEGSQKPDNLRNDNKDESVTENSTVVVRYQPKMHSRYKILLEDL